MPGEADLHFIFSKITHGSFLYCIFSPSFLQTRSFGGGTESGRRNKHNGHRDLTLV